MILFRLSYNRNVVDQKSRGGKISGRSKIASASKRIITNQYFRIRINVEEQHAQKHDRFRRGRQIAQMIYEHFRATGAHAAAFDFSDLLNVSLPGDDIQDSIQDRTKLNYLQVKHPRKMSGKFHVCQVLSVSRDMLETSACCEPMYFGVFLLVLSRLKLSFANNSRFHLR